MLDDRWVCPWTWSFIDLKLCTARSCSYTNTHRLTHVDTLNSTTLKQEQRKRKRKSVESWRKIGGGGADDQGGGYVQLQSVEGGGHIVQQVPVNHSLLHLLQVLHVSHVSHVLHVLHVFHVLHVLHVLHVFHVSQVAKGNVCLTLLGVWYPRRCMVAQR